MQNIKKYTCRSVWIFSLLFSSTLLRAQNAPYHGGFGRGDTSTSSSLLSCNNFRFSGAFGSGDSCIRTTLLSCNNFRFAGSFGSGDSSITTALLACNNLRFTGGVGHGDSNISTNLLNCNSFRFSGDSSNGFAVIKTNLLNCNLFRFSGDTADGSSLAEFIRPRNFLGNDTTIKILCSNETFNLLSLYNIAGLTTTWNSVTPTAAGLGNYQIVATSFSGCRDTAQALVKQDIAKWNGSVSSNWHDTANWDSGKIPDENTHVIIPGNTVNPCQIKDLDATAASVQAKSSGTFSIINNRKLVISARCTSLPIGL